jgi:hypothetical protein
MLSEYGIAAGNGFKSVQHGILGSSTFGTGAEPFALISMLAVAFLFLYFVFR